MAHRVDGVNLVDAVVGSLISDGREPRWRSLTLGRRGCIIHGHGRHEHNLGSHHARFHLDMLFVFKCLSV